MYCNFFKFTLINILDQQKNNLFIPWEFKVVLWGH